LVPTYLLKDYLAGNLGATGAMLALLRRASEGGSYHVMVSLTRTAMWVQSLGLEDDVSLENQGKALSDYLRPILDSRKSVYGIVEQLAPVAQLSQTKPYWSMPAAPLGADHPEWRPLAHQHTV